MARLVFVLFLLLAIVAALAVLLNGIAALSRRQPAQTPGWPDMTPKTLQNIAFALLIILMFGVVTGWMVGGG